MANVPVCSNAAVVENVRLARDTYRLRLAAPELARRIVPGQFVMLRIPRRTDPLLGRAFALYDTYDDPGGATAGIDIVHYVIGKMTRMMARLAPGDEVEIWGPLGNGFTAVRGTHLMMVAGGIGQTPFLALANAFLGKRRYGIAPREAAGPLKKGDWLRASHPSPHVSPPREVPVPFFQRQLGGETATLCYGVRTAELLAGLEDFQRAGVELRIATDDGTAGHRGFVTDLVEAALDVGQRPARVVGCGPVPMLAALQRIALSCEVPCLLSLETPMACGFGACFSCVVRVRQPDGTYDWRRTCVEGPVFDAALVQL
jgi:dihydroorotate dehydrogenase electron transfer subunit